MLWFKPFMLVFLPTTAIVLRGGERVSSTSTKIESTL
jgi:hypothetical protein